MKKTFLPTALGVVVLLAQTASPVPAQSTPAPTPSTAGRAAQAPPPPKPDPAKPIPPVSERVDVSVTNIEVVVTDSKGNRVSGLTKDDFEVFQDRVPQTITNFYAVAGGKLLLEDGKTVAIDSPAEVEEVPRELRNRYVIYIDNLNIQPQNRNRMFKRLTEFLATAVGPQTEAMVVTYNRSLKVKRRFTIEKSEVLAAVEDTKMETGGGTTLAGERRDALSRINEARSQEEAIRIARTYAQSLRNDLQFAVDAIKTTLNGLAGMEGRKTFIYVSEGLPAQAGAELFDTITRKFPGGYGSLEVIDFDMNTKYATIVQSANANGVTIWALDASGLAGDDLVSAENRNYDTRPSTFTMRQNTQGPLLMLAEETGGMAAVNTNDWKQSLDELSKDFSNFYSIGYRTTRAASDRPHSVEIKVKRKGLRARFRKGLVEKTPETRVAEAVESALDYARDENPLELRVELQDSKPYKEEFLQTVQLYLPIGRLGLLPSGDRYEASYFVYVMVKDAKGDRSDLQVQRETITVPVHRLADAQKSTHPYRLDLIVRPGAHRLSLAVRDGATNTTSYYQKSFFVSVLPKEPKKTG